MESANISREHIGPPRFALRENTGEPGAVRTKSPRPGPKESDGSGGPALRCRACRFKITDKGARIEVGGKHGHTFFNPHGLVFDIGCFARAPGCGLIGSPTTEFAWFPGHAWRIAMCRGCGVHLGWSFSLASGSSFFFGLILDLLVEESDEK